MAIFWRLAQRHCRNLHPAILNRALNTSPSIFLIAPLSCGKDLSTVDDACHIARYAVARHGIVTSPGPINHKQALNCRSVHTVNTGPNEVGPKKSAKKKEKKKEVDKVSDGTRIKGKTSKSASSVSQTKTANEEEEMEPEGSIESVDGPDNDDSNNKQFDALETAQRVKRENLLKRLAVFQERLQETAADDPQRYYLLTNTAVTMERLGRRAMALDMHTQALQLRPDDPNAYFFRASAYMDAGQLKASEEDLVAGLKKDPSNQKLRNLALTLQRRVAILNEPKPAEPIAEEEGKKKEKRGRGRPRKVKEAKPTE